MRKRLKKFQTAVRRPLVQYQRNTILEWLALMGAALALSVAIGVFGWGRQADSAIYDAAVNAATVREHASPEIVVVGIDDASLAAIGRWPWRRRVLADLIDRIADDAPRAIGLDVILSEADTRSPEDDAALAKSIARAPNVVLPAVVETTPDGPRIRHPLGQLGGREGHINIFPDPDGVVRQVYLRETVGQQSLTHFAAALLDASGDTGAAPPRRIDPGEAAVSGGWARQDRFRIPFAGPPGTFAQVSAVDVLRGETPRDRFRGKIVLIGAIASGLGDVFPTPVARNGEGISGIELIANTVQALKTGRGIVTMPSAGYWFLTMLVVLGSGLSSLLLAPRHALMATIALSAGSLACSVALVRAQIWCAPVNAALVSVLIYPLWSWRRQEAALRFLSDRLDQLEGEPGLLAMSPGMERTGHHLDARMLAVFRLTTALRDVRHFLADGLEALTEATVICDTDGRVLLANRRMHQLAPLTLKGLGVPSMPHPALRDVIDEVFVSPEVGAPCWDAIFESRHGSRADAAQCGAFARTVDMSTKSGHEMLLRGAPLRSDFGSVAGHIVTFIDITELRQAERQREESLRFISHDMRSPQASILGLIDMQRVPGKGLPESQLLERIGAYANRTLDLADDFIHLARAEAPNWTLVETDIVGVVLDATDELWALAKTRQVRLETKIEVDSLIADVEPFLLVRAVSNLVSNAIKFSPPDTVVSVRLYPVGRDYAIEVSDQGPGIARARQSELFKPFSRVPHDAKSAPPGAGLGLVFVRTVVERHGGHVTLQSDLGAGATFTLVLPNAGSSEAFAD